MVLSAQLFLDAEAEVMPSHSDPDSLTLAVKCSDMTCP